VLRHYLRIVLRVLSKNPGFSFINITGLSVGIGVALLLLVFARNELTFDRMHEKAPRTYRAWVLEDYGEDQQFFNTTTPVRTGPDLAASLPEVEAMTRFDSMNNTVRLGEVSHSERLFMVDESFLSIFDFPVLRGDPATMFSSQENIVLTESAARRYFADADPMGRVLSVEFDGAPRDFEVAGVLADVPENSSLQFELLLPYAITEWLYPDRMKEAFFNVHPETYVLLRNDAALEEVQRKIPGILTSLLGDRVEDGQYQVGLQPLVDIHMNPDFPVGYSPVVSPVYVWILIGLAALILTIASINFVTLSVSRSLERAKEIGVRKVMGAGRTQLMGQYWGEALLLTGVSMGLGLGMAQFALPAFNGLAQRSLTLPLSGPLVLILIGLFLFVGLFSGLYPAIVLSRFSPVEAFRGKVSGRADRSLVRKGLVVAQFGLSILLIASTLVMSQQLRYVQNKDLGFTKESVLSIPTVVTTEDGKEIANRLRFLLAGRDDIVSISSAAALFDENGWVRIGYTATDGSYRRHFANVVDYDFIRTMGLRLSAGRDFDPNQPSDPDRAMIINRAFAASHGWDDPLSETIPGNFDDHEIIGVVEDFNFASLHTAIEPAMFALTPNVAMSGAADVDYRGSFSPDIAVRLAGGNLPETLTALKEAWAEVAPDTPFTFSFLDDAIAGQYRQEQRLSEIVTLGSLLAILIAGLGLFGLAAMSVVRRSKEIGLRKVLGSNVSGIVTLFTREFATLVGVAFVLAAPLAWLGMRSWLNGFAFRTQLGAGPFLLAGVIALAVMLVAVSFQSLRAAYANPVDALRDE
jgi:putative ABC transport system permease protein